MSDNSVRARMKRHAEWMLREIEEVLARAEADAVSVRAGASLQVIGRVRDRIGQLMDEVQEVYDHASAEDRA